MFQRIKFILKFLLAPSKFYFADGLFTHHNFSFIHTKKFKEAYNAGLLTKSWGSTTINIKWRIHTILWAANQVKNIEGDFVECGVNKGGIAKSVIAFLDFNSLQKTFWLFDTFEGNFHEDLLTEEEKNNQLHKTFNYQSTLEEVRLTFKNDPVNIIQGFIPDTLKEFKNDKIAFLSIDMNSVQPEIEALRFFWNKLSKGGIIVLDDYAYHSHELQNIAMNNLSEELNFSILTLPTGQGLIIK